jgi:hypothetical protein
VNLGDVRMIERREHFRLALKARQAIPVGRKRFGEELQGDVALQPGIAGAIHHTHAAGPDGPKNIVRAEETQA